MFKPDFRAAKLNEDMVFKVQQIFDEENHITKKYTLTFKRPSLLSLLRKKNIEVVIENHLEENPHPIGSWVISVGEDGSMVVGSVQYYIDIRYEIPVVKCRDTLQNFTCFGRTIKYDEKLEELIKRIEPDSRYALLIAK